MLGLRFALLRPPQRDWWTDGTMEWLWPAAEQARVPIALLAGDFLPIVARVAERHPGLKLMVDHLGRVSRAQDEPAFANLPDLLALARFPNVAVKASGAPSYSSQPYPYRNIQPVLRQIFDAFGPERMFWGTDITRMPCSWRQCVTLFTEELPWLTGRDRELVMGEAVCDWLDWHPRQAFDSAIVETAAREKEVELTTFGCKTARPSRRITWITALDGRLYIRSGPGLTRDWPKNLLANGRGILHMAGQHLPVRARHVTDPEEARSLHAPVKQKYNAERPSSKGDEPLTPAERAVFELLPRG